MGMKLEGMVISQSLSTLIKTEIGIALVCLCLGFGGGYYKAGHKTDIDKSSYQIVYDAQDRKFFAPKAYLVSYDDNVSNEGSATDNGEVNNKKDSSSPVNLFYNN